MKELLDKNLESNIVFLLKEKPLLAKEIIEKLQKKRPGTTKQGVYLALRKLRKKEVVAISGKLVSLHQAWVSRMKKLFEKTSAETGSADLLRLEEGDRVSYRFGSLLALDMFWAHAFALFMSSMKPGGKMLLYNPHEWFLVAREESEPALIREAGERKVSWLALIGGNTPLDREARRFFDGKYAECHFLGRDIFPNDYYANCFGDYMIEVRIGRRAAEKIESIYRSEGAAAETASAELEKIVAEKGEAHRMRISKNKKKADTLRKIFKKYFLV